MCNNKFAFNSSESEHYRFLGECAAMVLKGKQLQEIAEYYGISVEKLVHELEDIQEINPTLYKQIQLMK